MTKRLRIHKADENSLIEQAAYISLDSPDAANRLIVTFYQTVEAIPDFPFSGNPANNRFPNLPKSNRTMRIKGFPELHIIYEVTKNEVIVWEVWHAKRDQKTIRKPD